MDAIRNDPMLGMGYSELSEIEFPRMVIRLVATGHVSGRGNYSRVRENAKGSPVTEYSSLYRKFVEPGAIFTPHYIGTQH